MAQISSLSDDGQRLLALLVARLRSAVPTNPSTFISYGEVHAQLGLEQLGPTFGESLKMQGLNSLANWTATASKPAITGLIIDRGKLTPGKGYFTLFGKPETDFAWWAGEIEKSKKYDWSPYLPSVLPPSTPVAADFERPADRQKTTTYRILRDSLLACRVKQIHNYECQLCGHTIVLPSGTRYAEAHHIQPLGTPHNGPDCVENILCLCPNHHVELDYGVRSLDLSTLRTMDCHCIDTKYANYHNEIIWKASSPAEGR